MTIVLQPRLGWGAYRLVPLAALADAGLLELPADVVAIADAGAPASDFRSAILAGAPAIFEQLATMLSELLGAARADAALVVDADWQNLNPASGLDSSARAAFSRLADLAPQHDRIRQAAVGLYRFVDATMDPIRHGLAIEAFAGYGVRGPTFPVGSLERAPVWRWGFGLDQPGPGPVGMAALRPTQRIVLAALGTSG